MIAILGWGLATAAIAEEGEPTALDAATVQEIERLRAEIERLLATLPEASRDEALDLLWGEPKAATDSAAGQQTPLDPQPQVDTVVAIAEPAEPAESAEPAEPVATTEPDSVELPTAPTRGRRAPCNTLDVFDENGDGKVSGLDRYWRYLYVWVDDNRDDRRQDKEIESVYEAGVREIGRRLDVFYRKKGGLGELRIRRNILLDLAGDGFGGGRRPDDGVLLVDADGLGRGDGPKVVDGSGAPVTGKAAIVAGWRFRLADGSELAIRCPGASDASTD